MKRNNINSFKAIFLALKHCTLSSINAKGKFKKNYFYWEFDAKPSTFSKIYRVLLVWDFKYATPQVFILNDELRKVEKTRNIPHLYCREKIKLCLYYPGYSEFNMFMPLCKTIIPWTYYWLQYYEEWLVSGEWKGGDAPHNTIPVNNQERTENISVSKKKKLSIVDRVYKERKNIFDTKHIKKY